MTYWTHYWRRDTVKTEERLVRSGQVPGKLAHAADNRFRACGVSRGDVVFIISNFEGQFRLYNALVVGQVVGQREAQRVLPYDPWEADDHLIAAPGTETPLRFDLTLTDHEVRSIEFVTPNGVKGPVYDRTGRPDRQTFRRVREITPATARVFEAALR